MKKPPKKTKDLALYWALDVRTANRLRQMEPPAPLHDVSATIEWLARQPATTQLKLKRSFVARVTEMRAQQAGGKSGSASTGATSSAADSGFEKWKTARGEVRPKDTDALDALKEMRDFALHKIREATKDSDMVGLNWAKNLLQQFSGIIHDEELRAQKLGRELGDLMPRAQAEAVARALGYWLIVGADAMIAGLATKLVAESASGPLSPEQTRRVLESAVLSVRVIEPIARAASVQTGMTLPDWFVAAMRSALADTMQDGAAEFDRLYPQKPNKGQKP